MRGLARLTGHESCTRVVESCVEKQAISKSLYTQKKKKKKKEILLRIIDK